MMYLFKISFIIFSLSLVACDTSSGGDKGGGIKLKITREDTNADGVIDVIIEETFDREGNIVSFIEDSDADNFPDIEISYSYIFDDEFRPLKQSRDTDRNGIADESTTFTYDAAGNLLTEKVDADERNGFDDAILYTYTNSVLSKKTVDIGNDGILDEIETYTADAKSNIVSASFDTNADNAIDRVEDYTYDNNQNRLSTRVDIAPPPLDKVYEIERIFSYDSNDYLVTESTNNDLDIDVDQVIRYTNDELGNQLRITVDTDNDGILEKSTNIVYEFF